MRRHPGRSHLYVTLLSEHKLLNKGLENALKTPSTSYILGGFIVFHGL